MKRSFIVGVFLVIIISGCATSGNMESQLKHLKEEIYAEIRYQTGSVRDDLKKEFKTVESNLKNEIVEIRETHKKDKMEIDKTLIDHQKQIFNNRLVNEDNARRVYLLESIITARTSIAPQIKEGYITFVSDDEVSISLGSINGVKAGDNFGVYKGKDKIATIRIDVVEVNSSKGIMLSKERAISIGDKVEIENKE